VKYGLNVINFGELGRPATIQEIARRAEAAGWDGIFTWDHVISPWDGVVVYDPWVLLAAAACATDRLVVGTNVTPVPRRRPLVLANQVATLDELSGGRAVLGVGIGGDVRELELLGEETDARVRASLLDAGLAVIRGRWQGRVWVGGTSVRARRRAARHDGWTTGLTVDEHGVVQVSPAAFAEQLALVLSERDSASDFDVVVEGYSSPSDRQLVREYEDAGASWWFDSINGLRGSREDLVRRVDAGPPVR
jgi:alkanesulfonate monooxygenase SsuD/methylene tetrahydromethanopterin reductase-like flavin-dependent oxidoreductase (luciferase family)